jgi:7-carboxy-7-deazaguanine synthase
MTYTIKEIFYTLQGEGRNAGRAAVFCRFAGCNLWTGREADRTKAICDFCDTDFIGTDGVGGGRFATAEQLAAAIAGYWPHANGGRPLVVLTGGEPLLQADVAVTEALHGQDFEIAIETNGTIARPAGIDWVCVSPKAGAELAITEGDELKFVFPQVGLDPEQFESLAFDHFLLQPKDGPERALSTAARAMQEFG